MDGASFCAGTLEEGLPREVVEEIHREWPPVDESVFEALLNDPAVAEFLESLSSPPVADEAPQGKPRALEDEIRRKIAAGVILRRNAGVSEKKN